MPCLRLHLSAMRAFLALPLPDDISDRLALLQKDLRHVPGGTRPVDPADFHITLAFLGDRLADAQVEAAHEAMERLSAPAPLLRLDGLDLFGGGTALAVRVAPDPALENLHRKVHSLLHGAGLMLPRERYRPHVTIARLSVSGGGPALAGLLDRHGMFGTGSFTPARVVLYRSDLGAKRAIHTELADYPLNPPRPANLPGS
ncbi:MAG: RNA 2',3'-cyclic phosphodiesterase [Paracoccaceae bacterium]